MSLQKKFREYARRYPRSRLNEVLRQAPSAGGASVGHRQQGPKGPRRLSLKEVASVWTVVRGAYRLSGLLRFRESRRKILVLLETITFHPASYIPCLKQALHECRRYYIEGGQLNRHLVGSLVGPAGYRYLVSHKKAAMQLSYISRCLPKGKLSEKAFINYMNDLTSQSPPVPDDLAYWIRRQAEAFERHKQNASPSFGGLSSCTEYTRKEGGLPRATYELLVNRKPSPKEAAEAPAYLDPDQYDRNPEGQPVRRRFARRRRAIPLAQEVPFVSDPPTDHRSEVLVDIGHSLADNQPPFEQRKAPKDAVQPVAVPEFGYKLRWVTKSPAHVTYLGQVLRSRYFPVLYRFQSTGEPLKGEEREFFVGRQRRDALVFSSDLSRATDLVSRDAMRIICEVFQIPLTQLTDHEIWWKGRSYRQTRGSLMGLPMSWVSLSIIHMAVADYVSCASGLSRRSFRIKGDDLLAYWTPSAIQMYKDKMSQLGFQVNDKKSFVSKTHGLFCEKAYHADYRPDGVYLTRIVGLYSLKWMIDKSPTTSVTDGAVSSPWFLTIGGHLHELPKREQKWMIHFLLENEKDAFYRRGLDPYLPTQLGGLGLPHPTPHKRIRPQDAKLVTAYHNDRGGGFLVPPSVLAPDEHSKECATMLDAAHNALRYYPEGGTHHVLDGRWSVYSARLTALASKYAFLKGKLISKRSIKLSRYLARLKTRRRILLRKAAAIKPLRWDYSTTAELLSRLKPSAESVYRFFESQPALADRLGYQTLSLEETGGDSSWWDFLSREASCQWGRTTNIWAQVPPGTPLLNRDKLPVEVAGEQPATAGETSNPW